MDLPEAFDCAICQRHISNHWAGHKRRWSHPPICRVCETYWGQRVPPCGSFRDRHIAIQISALAEAIETEARHQHYRRFGHAAS